MAGERHVPMRRCVVCRTSYPKERLIRFVRDEDGGWRLDARGRAPGRGAWVCSTCAREPDPKRLARGFRGRPDAILTQLRDHMDHEAPDSGGQHG